MARSNLDDADRRLVEEPNFCHLVTYGKDGSAHVVIVWVDLDGERLVLNGAPTRSWGKRLAANGSANLTIQSRENPYEYLTVAVSLAERTPEGASEQLDRMAKKYLDEDEYPWEAEDRELFFFTPTRVHRYGG